MGQCRPERKSRWYGTPNSIQSTDLAENFPEYALTLSTKSAIYSGILSVEVADLEPTCHAANCTWPTFPTLAVCGECIPVRIETSCAAESDTCDVTTQSKTNITIPVGVETESFKVTPLEDQQKDGAGSEKTIISQFEMMAISNRTTGTRSNAAQCSLWICVKFFAISVNDGKSTQTVVGIHDQTRFEPSSHFVSDEHVFVHLPSQPGQPQPSAHGISDRSVRAIRDFMDTLTQGYLQTSPAAIYFPSDWIEAMWQATADTAS